MVKAEKDKPFQTFQKLTKHLLSVPRTELQKKLDNFKQRRRKKKIA